MQTLAFPETFHLLFYVGLLFIISQLAGNLAERLNLPRMIGYITAGMVSGPHLLDIFSHHMIEKDLIFFRDFALSVIAFSMGGTLHIAVLKRFRSSIMWMTLFQTIVASCAVFLTLCWLMPFLHMPTNESDLTYLYVIAIILGAVASATAPAAILSLVEEYEAHRDFRETLLGIVALDDMIAVLFYTIAIAIGASILGQHDGQMATTFGQASIILLTEVGIGLLCGFLVAKSLPFFPFSQSMLGVVLGIIMLACGLCLSLGLSPLLTCLTLGFMVSNVAKRQAAEDAMSIMRTTHAPVFGMFFFMAGAHVNFELVIAFCGLSLALSLSRFFGKYTGTVLGGMIAKTDPKLRHNLGLAMTPAAGVMVGLTMNAKDTFGHALGGYADMMVTIVIGSALINEFITPFFVRHAIRSANDDYREKCEAEDMVNTLTEKKS